MRIAPSIGMLVWASVVTPGCTCRENVRPPSATATKIPAGSSGDSKPDAADAAKAPGHGANAGNDALPMLRVQSLQTQDDDTLTPLSKFAGGTVVRPGRRLLDDTQWFAVSCGPIAGTFELLRSSLQSQGWSEESTRDSNEIQAVTAQRDGLSVSIVVQQSKRSDCVGATVSITAFRLQR